VFLIFFLILSSVAAVPQNASGLARDNVTQGQSNPYTIKLFIPTAHMIHSNQITDQINGHAGDVIFATAFGLSTYNVSWSTRHINLNNISEGLMDDYVTAIEYDHKGNLWIGYSGGLQIYNGIYYQSIRDQQLLKEVRIHDLQRWNNEMWIATGHSGIHRYREGTWTWFQPGVRNGSGFYEVDSMTLDPSSNSLVIATENEGLWIVKAQKDPVQFDLLAGKSETFGLLEHVKRDPLGGVYFFNASTVIHFDGTAGFVPVLLLDDLTIARNSINDIAADSYGSLYLATDDGIFIWRDGAVYRHLTRFEGIGTSNIVETINVDVLNRVWFATQDDVGYYLDSTMQDSRIIIEQVTPAPVETIIPDMNVSPASPQVAGQKTIVQTPIPAPVVTNSSSGMLGAVVDPFMRAINAIRSLFGFSIKS
jgi:hypothetical protein